MPDFLTSMFIGALLAAIGFKYDSHLILALVLMSACLAFVTHVEGIPVVVRTGIWALGLGLGVIAVILALTILL